MNRSMLKISVSLLVTILLMTPAFSAVADCGLIRGTGQTFANPSGVFEGTATLVVDGAEENASVRTVILSISPSDDGTLHCVTSHTFVFGDGSTITTIDRVILSPTVNPGVYRLNTNATIEGGTGRFDGACGSIIFHGQVNFGTGSAEWRAGGRICSCG